MFWPKIAIGFQLGQDLVKAAAHHFNAHITSSVPLLRLNEKFTECGIEAGYNRESLLSCEV